MDLENFLFWVIMAIMCLMLIINAVDDAHYVNIGEPYIEETKICNIRGLESKEEKVNEMKGYFILGIGAIKKGSEEHKKYYYFKDTEYGLIMDSRDIDSIYVKETDKEPCLIKAVKKQKKKHEKNGEEREDIIEEVTILQVPYNTIKIDYNIE